MLQNLIKFIKTNYLDIAVYTSIFFIIFIDKYNNFGDGTFSDTPAYIMNSIAVLPLYPLIIDMFQIIFGEHNFWLICVVQFIISYTILFLAVVKIMNLLNLPKELRVFLMFVIGIFYSAVAVQVMTEAWAYPLFFMIVAYFMKIIYEKKPGDFYICVALITLLYLIRSQFIFLYPLSFLLLIILSSAEKSKWLKLRVYTFFISVMIAGMLFSYTANYFIHGKFIGSQSGGVVMLSTPSYLATPEDINLFKDDLIRKVFSDFLENMQSSNSVEYCDESKWKMPEEKDYKDLSESFPNWLSSNYERWYQAHIEKYIDSKSGKYKMTHKNGKCHLDKFTDALNNDLYSMSAIMIALDKNKVTDWIKINSITTEIALKLRTHHLYEWLCIFIITAFVNFGQFYMLSLYAVILITCYRSVKANQYKLQPVDIFLLLTLILHLANVAFVSFVAMAHDRYFIYTFVMIFCSVVIVLDKFRVYLSSKNIFKKFLHSKNN